MSKQRPRPPMREAARHPIHAELPAPSHPPRDHLFVLVLEDQKRRLAELLHADCQLDELAILREYVDKCFRFPVNVDWIDPDVEHPRAREVCCLGAKEEYDRRGLMIKCAIVGTDEIRFIPMEQLRGKEFADGEWDEADPVKVAARIISDYRFWVDELHGLDPSSIGFYDGPQSSGDEGGMPFMFGGHHHMYDNSYYSDDDDDGSDGDEMLFGAEDLSSGELMAELEAGELDGADGVLPMDLEDGDEGHDHDEDDDEEDDEEEDDDDDDDNEDLVALFGEGLPFDQEAEDDESNWVIDYASDLDEMEEVEVPMTHHQHVSAVGPGVPVVPVRIEDDNNNNGDEANIEQ